MFSYCKASDREMTTDEESEEDKTEQNRKKKPKPVIKNEPEAIEKAKKHADSLLRQTTKADTIVKLAVAKTKKMKQEEEREVVLNKLKDGPEVILATKEHLEEVCSMSDEETSLLSHLRPIVA